MFLAIGIGIAAMVCPVIAGVAFACDVPALGLVFLVIGGILLVTLGLKLWPSR